MNAAPVFDIPVPTPTAPPPGKWAREYEAFLRLLPGLLATHRDQYVAVHDGQVIGSGGDKLEVARRAYQLVGPVEVLVRLVTDRPPREVRIASPHVGPAGAG